jgi:shikimate kinase
MLIFLTGFMGAGKTTAGKKLAALMKYSFIDLDTRIEAETGRTVPELFQAGEFRFREIETMVLQASAELKDAVISCGGGTPCFNENLMWMKSHGITVYISMNPGALFHRLAESKQKRPLLAGKSDVELMEYIVETLKEREYFYRQCHYIVQGENLDVPQLLSTIRSGEAQLR